jgi:hypothetical protein
MKSMAGFLFLGASLFIGVDTANAGGDQGAKGVDWVIVRKPRSDLLAQSRRVFTEAPTQSGYTKRSVGLQGETLAIRAGVIDKAPGLTVERITVEGGKVEITDESITIEGGRVQIIRRPCR